MRLGAYECSVKTDSHVAQLYIGAKRAVNADGSLTISERHRHRYEVNNDFREKLQHHGMVISGVSPDYRLIEMIELPDHPYFIGTQAHPEFKSRPNRPHPLFEGLVQAALVRKANVAASLI